MICDGIVVLTSKWFPFQSAGVFRVHAFLVGLQKQFPGKKIFLIYPDAMQRPYFEDGKFPSQLGGVEFLNIPISNAMCLLRLSFFEFFFKVLCGVKVGGSDKNFIWSTTAKSGTGLLGVLLGIKSGKKVFLDFRDLFAMYLLEFGRYRVFYLFYFLIKSVDKFCFSRADSINLVSEGFRGYLPQFANKFSFYTNGFDADLFESEFRTQFSSRYIIRKEDSNATLQVTYVGNLGFGQGLSNLIRDAAPHMKSRVQLNIFGKGSDSERICQLASQYQRLHPNLVVNFFGEVSRSEVGAILQDSDLLLLPLNNVDAFEKVIPSKVFEYAWSGRPILAGVSGWLKAFLEDSIEGVYCFRPGNGRDLAVLLNSRSAKIRNADYCRASFLSKFDRGKIMTRYIGQLNEIS